MLFELNKKEKYRLIMYECYINEYQTKPDNVALRSKQICKNHYYNFLSILVQFSFTNTLRGELINQIN